MCTGNFHKRCSCNLRYWRNKLVLGNRQANLLIYFGDNRWAAFFVQNWIKNENPHEHPNRRTLTPCLVWHLWRNTNIVLLKNDMCTWKVDGLEKRKSMPIAVIFIETFITNAWPLKFYWLINFEKGTYSTYLAHKRITSEFPPNWIRRAPYLKFSSMIGYF